MTTYALSEPATVRRTGGGRDAASQADDVVARGSLADCSDILKTWSAEERSAVRIDLDDMNLRYGPAEIEELLEFLRDEGSGLSNHEISEISDGEH